MSLAATQRRMRRLIAHPEGVRAALAEERDAAPLRSLIVDDERLPAEDRLDVYANAYFYRVLDVMAGEFPALRRALGADVFHDLVTSYLVAHPSTHPSIRWIGGALPDFLASGELAAPFRRGAPWAADLARLEWALSLAFDAANAETLGREQLAALPPDAWQELALALVPSAARLDLDWPVGELRQAWRDAGEDAPPEQPALTPLSPLAPDPTRVCVWRRDERVHYRSLEDLEAVALDAVAKGVRFGVLCERIARETGEAEAPAVAAGWLAGWLDEGLLRR